MTALEQQLNQELQKSDKLNIELISKIEKQEIEFINKLLEMQKAYELNMEMIVNNNIETNNQFLEKLELWEESLQNLQVS